MKRMMRRLAGAALLAAVTAATPNVWAQTDAAAAYQQGKTAFQAGQFDKARAFFAQASQTDPKNPEVFLWLGKAEYQLGAIDEAVEAWRKTLELAPNEPYSAQMLKALRGNLADADSALALVDVLVKEGLYDAASKTVGRVLVDKALTDPQRVQALTLKATALIETGQVGEGEAVVQELLVKYPKTADPEQTSLLLAKAKLRNPDRVGEGVALLQKLVAEHKDTPSGVAAQYELLAFDLAQSVSADKTEALAKWVAAHADHSLAGKARVLLIENELVLTERSVEAAPNTPLTPADQAALAVADEAFKRIVRADEAVKLTQRIVVHLEVFYGKGKAYPAAISAVETLLKSPLPPSSRLVALRALGTFQTEAALREISVQAEADKLVAGPLPKSLLDAVGTFATITREFPADGGWRYRASIAERLRAIGATMPWPAKVTELKAPYAWAVEIALPVAKANADAAAVDGAAKTVTAIISEVGGIAQRSAQTLALNVNTQLLAAISPESPSWAGVMWGQAGILDSVAKGEFAENIKTGKLEANGQLSKTQQQLIAVLAGIVSRDAKQAPAAIERLGHLLGPWIAAGEYAVAEEAYGKLSAAVPETQRRDVQLAIVRLWEQKAMTEQQRLAGAGLAEPFKVDPSLASALKRLYELQAGVDDTDPFLGRVRAEIDRIVGHYKQIQYFGVAEMAVLIKSDVPVPQAEAYAQFQLAVLKDESARRGIVAILKQYKATDKLALTDSTRLAIAAYEKFITDHPTDPLANRAVSAVFEIASSFENYQAFDVAAGIYRDFSAFAAKIPALAKAAAGTSSVAERAAFGAVSTVDVKARDAMVKAMTKATAENKGTPLPPAKISDEFAAAIAAYQEFIKASPQSPLVSQAILRINAIALDYARADAWDIADSIYAGLLEGGLATREPERIEFCRGMCQIGKVMPEHAKEVLAALLSTGTAGNTGGGGGMAGGGFGGGRGGGAYGRDAGLEALKLKQAEILSETSRLDQAAGDRFGPVLAAPVAAAKPTGAAGPGHKDDMILEAPPVTVTAGVAIADERAKADNDTLAAISRQEARRAQQIAMLKDGNMPASQPRAAQEKSQSAVHGIVDGQAEAPVLSEEELARQQTALDAAYVIFQDISTKHKESVTAQQARGEIMVAAGYWRGILQWQRAAALTERFLKDNPTDQQLPQLRLEIAQDHLFWASQKLDPRTTSQEMLAEVTKRFAAARMELAKIGTDFPEERALVEDAQWRIATSFLTQARTVDAFSPTLARGQFVRAAKELQRVAGEYSRHPQIGNIPQMLWDISMELNNRAYHEEALTVWNILAIDYPTHPQAQQAQVMTAQTFQSVLGRPLRAAEVYLEINFARGGNDAAMQNAVFAIGADLKNQKRWIESLRVLESFVQSFPKHPQAGQALTTIGQIHQANEAWQDAITAYRRVIDEFPASGQWVQDAKWSIAECTINLSRWHEAIGAYEQYVASFPKDPKVAEANRRIGVLKDLANYQKLVDEDGLKAYDAQFQIASIVNGQLANWRKAVIEFQKVADNWPKSHLAADALHTIGVLYLQNNEVEEARVALRAVASRYPDSPYACDSLFQIGKSYEDEANRLSTLTRDVTWEQNKDIAQRRAYSSANTLRGEVRQRLNDKLEKFRSEGKKEQAEYQSAINAGNGSQFDDANFSLAVQKASQEQESLTANELADRQDKINAALRKAVVVYAEASKVPAGDKAGEALLHMAVIYNDRLGERPQAMSTWLEIVRQFSGTAVAEEASWQIAQHYEKAGQYAEAVESYKSFLRNYRRSPKAADAQFFIAENYEHLGQWIAAMDQYTNYVQNFPDGALTQKAKEQISFIKTYRL